MWMQCGVVQCSVVRCGAVQCGAVQYSRMGGPEMNLFNHSHLTSDKGCEHMMLGKHTEE